MKNIIYLMGLFACFHLASCSVDPCGADKDAFITKYDAFMEEIDEANLEHNDKAWKAYDNQFQQFVEECYDVHEAEMSLKEERRFWAKSVAYYYKRYGKSMWAELRNPDAKMGALVREHMDDIGNELTDVFNDFNLDLNINGKNIELNGEKIDHLLDELGKDMGELGEKWGKKLEELFEDK